MNSPLAPKLNVMIRLCGQLELLKTCGEIFLETEHLEDVSGSETVALTCLFVKESLIFSVLLPRLPTHLPPPLYE